MGTIRVGINGFGRIGRTILRELFAQKLKGINKNLEIVAVNNPGELEISAHLLRYDSVHGNFPYQIEQGNGHLKIENQKITFFNLMDPSEIAWSELDVEIVIDATGKFRDKNSLSKHLKGSVKKVIMCAPGKALDGTFVMGINHKTYNPKLHHVISNASCTTNCLAPVAKVLHENFGIHNGFMTTVHAYTSDQNLHDNTHDDLRRARSAALSMIPTTTGAAKALGEVIPELGGKLDGSAIRVPTPNVSVVDLTVNLNKTVSTQEINSAMKSASENDLKGILAYSTEELVSVDFLGRKESSIFDAPLTNTIGNTAKVVSWYDNEVGFSNRVLDLTHYIGQFLK